MRPIVSRMSTLTGRAAAPALGKRALGVFCGLAAAAIWGGGAVVSRYLVTANLGPADLTLLRYVGSFPVALALAFMMGDRMLIDIGWRRVAVLLLLGGPLYHALVIGGYQYASAGGGALLLSGLLPIFAFGLSCTTSMEGLSRGRLAGAIAVLAGLALFGIGAGSAISLTGIGIFSVAAVTWAGLNEFVRRWQVDAFRLTIALALFSPVFAPLYLLTGSARIVTAPLPELLLQVTYHGWLVAIVATALFFASVRLAGAQVAAVLQALSPGFSAILGAVILSEPLMLAQISGLVLVTVGVLLTTSGSSSAVPSGGRIIRGGSSGYAFLVGIAPRLKLNRWS